MAEGRGFEPRKGVNPCWFSRPVHSTALPSLRILVWRSFNGHLETAQGEKCFKGAAIELF